MKKALLFIVFSGFLFGFNLTPDAITDLQRYRLKDHVKSVMETKYSLAGESKNAIKDRILFQKLTRFDVLGMETENILFENGDVYLKSFYVFGDDNKQSALNEYNPDGTLNLNITYKYDVNGFRTEAFCVWEESRIIGEQGEHSEYYFEILHNEIYNKIHFKNDYRGYCIEENYMSADSTLSFRFVYKYDFRGNKIESAYIRGNERLSWMTKFKYDRYDNLIESRVYKSNRIAVLSSYKHQFDEVGNWVVRSEEREVYVNILTAGLDKANTVTERTIEYY